MIGGILVVVVVLVGWLVKEEEEEEIQCEFSVVQINYYFCISSSKSIKIQ